MINIVLSERTKPRALQTMKDIYAAHTAECPSGADCPVMVGLKRDIEALEHDMSPAPVAKKRSAGNSTE